MKNPYAPLLSQGENASPLPEVLQSSTGSTPVLWRKYSSPLGEVLERCRDTLDRDILCFDRNHLLEDFVIPHIFVSEKERNN